MPTVHTSVLEQSYTDFGPTSGLPVIMVHGWPDAARGWSGVAARVTAAGYRLVVLELRGTGSTVFRSRDTVRDGTAPALAQDVIELADGLGLDRFAVVGHDWGARIAYTLAALHPDRLTSIAALALGFQPGGRFVMPDFAQAQRFWYQWLMFVDAGAEAIRSDPVGFARRQWQTWSPLGWWDEAEFEATADAAFRHPDWPAVTLSAYRARFRVEEPLDSRYDDQRRRLASVERLTVPTLMIQGRADACDPPELTEGQEPYFDDYRRVVLDGVGHFPHREAPDRVADAVLRHLAS
jgi:pimeloyl-ACP methyl ester carboxylesterase